MLSLTRRIQVVRIGDDARVLKKIDFAGTTLSVRRDSIACVADSRSYALVEVERQLKIPLMSVSSLDDGPPGDILGQAQDVSASTGGGLLRSSSSAQPRSQTTSPDAPSHRRGTSLGNLISGVNRRQEARASEEEPVFQQPSPPDPASSPRPPEDVSSSGTAPAVSVTPAAADVPPPVPAKSGSVFLKPLIVSPTPEEFLIVTGTAPLEPGIGMFVNLDGDPTRPTIEFDRYPKEIVVDGGNVGFSTSRMSVDADLEGYVLASMGRDFPDGLHYGLEIQRFDVDPSEGEPVKHWLEPPIVGTSPQNLGMRSLLGLNETFIQEIVDSLCRQRFKPFSHNGVDRAVDSIKSLDSRTAASMEMVSREKELFERDNDSQDDDSLSEGWETTRNAEEVEFARRLANTTTRVAVWSGANIWWAIRNPLILQLDAELATATDGTSEAAEERKHIFRLLASIRDRDARTELEFLTFSYVRQRAGILLLQSFREAKDSPFLDSELRLMEEVLVEGLLDPRVVLSLIPGVRNEVIETRRGIWIFGGVKTTADALIQHSNFDKASTKSSLEGLPNTILHFLHRYLTAWRRKKGFGSIPDESEVFRTVDAALLAVLLELDKSSAADPDHPFRAELYELVDSGVDCFDRAETLIESHHRLFVLSRLYQSRRMAGEVLESWKRIIEGEPDDGGELVEGEQRVREYLQRISNQALVQEYGVWLANRNPKLGVQVFAEDQGRARKFEPTEVVKLLRAQAPSAVKYYLEYLVFGKGHTIYVNELIQYYIEIVIGSLETSPAAREAILSTYTSYRALQPPKPTYRQFLTDNAPADDEAWQSRLRLLQLLGGPHSYDSANIHDRLSALRDVVEGEDLLVPETIILNGRERRHEDALRLLVHKLGDYDTAVAYCLRGGSSIYSIYQAPLATARATASDNDQQQQQPPLSPLVEKSRKAPRRRESAPPTSDQQSRLFRSLLGEFLALEDVGDRVEQTGLLLDRFGGFFDVADVLALIPDSWSVDVVSGFLVKALRRLVVAKHEATVARSLSSAQNLRVQHDLVLRIDEKGPTVETA
ncbi:vacuolar protein sorting-associated protein 3 [Microdochium nivale]|nr:vacuolar protein sorting-associated protein 3 [Microdochium nivale]